MSKLGNVKTLQRLASAYASFQNYFHLDQHLASRETFKQSRSTVLAEWRQLAP